jgi:hypothetical protein
LRIIACLLIYPLPGFAMIATSEHAAQGNQGGTGSPWEGVSRYSYVNFAGERETALVVLFSSGKLAGVEYGELLVNLIPPRRNYDCSDPNSANAAI